MKRLEHFQEILKREKVKLKERYKVKEIGIFGSYVRDEESKSSDLDILVDFDEVPSLFELVELQDYLSDMLKVKVDLVMKSGLKPRIGSRILREVVLI
jgi:predicted nucleotidyltransferase